LRPPPKYKNRRSYASAYDAFELEQPPAKSVMRDLMPYVFGGAMLVAAFAFAGHQLGRNAIAHTAVPDIEVSALASTDYSPVKGSLEISPASLETVGLDTLRLQTDQVVEAEGKGDMALLDLGTTNEALATPEVLAEEPQVVEAPAGPKPVLKPTRKIAKLAEEHRLRIVPASFNPNEEAAPTKKVTRKLELAAKPDDLDKSFKLPKAEKQKVLAKRRVRMAEENCLARAVYFEARSESVLGQMAVAKVVLNRVKSPKYPNTICGVVYQGSHRRNSCQFSFACDGQADEVRQPAAWAQAKAVAKRAIDGDPGTAAKLRGALHYHADYVKPKWAKSMRKAIRIGTHIFYTGG
jgi:spore germination cell wall hydrolase CwlJ-like protein